MLSLLSQVPVAVTASFAYFLTAIALCACVANARILAMIITSRVTMAKALPTSTAMVVASCVTFGFCCGSCSNMIDAVSSQQ